MNKYSKTLNRLGLAIFLIVFVLSAWYFQQHVQQIIQSIKHLGLWAPIGFVLVYCFSTLMLLPTMVLTLAGGAIFGPFEGTLFNLTGASLGACLAFLISRHLAADWVHQRKARSIQQLMDAVERHGWQSVALLRVLPLLPFNLVNYGMGVTAIRFRVYAVTTVIFLLPPEILYTYCGHAGVNLISKPEKLWSAGGLFFAASVSLLLLLLWYVSRQRMKKEKTATLEKADGFPDNPAVRNE